MALPSFVVAAAILLAGAKTASAQNPDTIEKEAQKPSQQTSAQSQAVQAETEAGKLQTESGQDASYEQVLADPDNVDLNYRYARAQVRRGDLKGACATLERILLIDPNLPRIRLFYAVALFRLDNLAESEHEISALLGQNPPPDLRSEAGQYLAEIRKRRKRTQLSGRLSTGFEYDDNRNAAPAGGQRLFLDTPIALAPGSRKRDDTSLLFMGNIDVRHDLGAQAGHKIFGTFNYYRAEQTLIKTLNLTAYSLAGGGVYKAPWADITPQLTFDHVMLAQTTFLRNRGVAVRVDKKWNKRLGLYADFKDVYQDYSRTEVVPTADDRTGIQIDATLGADFMLNPKMRLGASALYAIKHAHKNFDAFKREGLSLNHVWVLGRGTFLLSNLTFNYDRYDAADSLISAKMRRDKTWRANATYGAPMSLLTPKLKDLLLTFTYEYYQATSTVENYAYTNNKMAALLTYKWETGF